MANHIDEILGKEEFSHQDIVALLKTNKTDRNKIYKKAAEIKEMYVGKRTYFRGLIELSNVCAKNCYYCGIRRGNSNVDRYTMTDLEVFRAVKYAIDNKFASIVIQSGELTSPKFVEHITYLLNRVSDMYHHDLGITLSMGEQTAQTYKKWSDAGANRYLMRIEASNKELYQKLHPNDSLHDYDWRLNSLKKLQELNYQTGTGVMIGLPFQTMDHLAEDLLFMKEFDIDMVGMGPYIEHKDTPLYKYRDILLPKEERFNLSMKMVAILRIMMKDINIAATTAMQSLDPLGREKAIKVGANVIMPNLTPLKYREGYLLYEDKPCVDEEADECKTCLEARIQISGDRIGYGEQGTSKHYLKRISKKQR
ncbi:MAG: [FeFe] hydrogenase H-cluster radical SAM maturase HydE [Bacteroidota bacterium]|nr:[FeFe] hydrogenase H-cluster radical SAM maturase HydE [Bacteroidota bacterium]